MKNQEFKSVKSVKSVKFPKNIRATDGSQPHWSWGGWQKFLKTCEVRDKYRGVIFFGKTNCNYILFADGLLIQNYAYHGVSLMAKIRKYGVAKVKKEIQKDLKELRDIMERLRSYNILNVPEIKM